MTDDNATPMALERLLDAVENAINDATWYPEHSIGTAQMLVYAQTITDLRLAYDRYVYPDSENDDD